MQFILEVPSAQFVSIYEPIYSQDFPCYYSVSFDHRLLPEKAQELLRPEIANSLSKPLALPSHGLLRASSQRRPLAIPLRGHWDAVQRVLMDADMCNLKRDLLLRDTPVKLNCRIYEYRSSHGSGHSIALESVQVDGSAMRQRFNLLIEEARALNDETEEDEVENEVAL